jgi:hypothetical protein
MRDTPRKQYAVQLVAPQKSATGLVDNGLSRMRSQLRHSIRSLIALSRGASNMAFMAIYAVLLPDSCKTWSMVTIGVNYM